MDIANWETHLDGNARVQGRLCLSDERVIERLFETMVLRDSLAACDTAGQRRLIQDGREINARRLPVINGRFPFNSVNPADHFVHGAEPQLRHVLAYLLGEKEKEVNHMLGLPLELLTQGRILSGD